MARGHFRPRPIAAVPAKRHFSISAHVIAGGRARRIAARKGFSFGADADEDEATITISGSRPPPKLFSARRHFRRYRACFDID